MFGVSSDVQAAPSLAGKLLAALGLGYFVRTVIVAGDRGGGRPTWLYCCCPVQPTMQRGDDQIGVRGDVFGGAITFSG